jgi:hypothetical protein
LAKAKTLRQRVEQLRREMTEEWTASINEALTEEERLQLGGQLRMLHSEVRELYQRLARLD